MQATLKPNPLATKQNKTFLRFLLDWAAVITLVLCFVVFTLLKGNRFMSVNNMINILRAMSITTVFGIAATVTMAPDGFDMSACTLASCSAYVFVSMYLWYGLPLWACVAVCILVTLVMYQLTMFLILVCKIPDMLATCALMFVHQGLGQWYIGGGAVSTGMRLPSGASPVRTKLEASFSAIGREPWLIIIMLACVLVAYIFLEYTKHGRFIYAMGGNPEAARLAGVNIKKYRLAVFTITGILAAVAGIIMAARTGSAQPSAGASYPFDCMTAVVLGGVSFAGGSGSMLGAMMGVIIIGVLNNGMQLIGMDSNMINCVKGIVLLIAIGIDSVQRTGKKVKKV